MCCVLAQWGGRANLKSLSDEYSRTSIISAPIISTSIIHSSLDYINSAGLHLDYINPEARISGLPTVIAAQARDRRTVGQRCPKMLQRHLAELEGESVLQSAARCQGAPAEIKLIS